MEAAGRAGRSRRGVGEAERERASERDWEEALAARFASGCERTLFHFYANDDEQPDDASVRTLIDKLGQCHGHLAATATSTATAAHRCDRLHANAARLHLVTHFDYRCQRRRVWKCFESQHRSWRSADGNGDGDGDGDGEMLLQLPLLISVQKTHNNFIKNQHKIQ